MKFLVDVMDVRADGFETDEKLVGDLFVAVAPGQKLKHLPLPPCQFVQVRGLFRSRYKCIDHLPCDD